MRRVSGAPSSLRQPLAVEEAASPHNNLGCGCRDGVRDWIGVFLLPRVPLYPQGVRRIRRAAEPPTAAQSLRAAPAVAALLRSPFLWLFLCGRAMMNIVNPYG